MANDDLVARGRQLARQQATGDDFHQGRVLKAEDTMYWQFADEIERLTADVARLREALGRMDKIVTYYLGENPGHRFDIPFEIQREYRTIIRAALAKDATP